MTTDHDALNAEQAALLTRRLLEDIRARVEAITPGEWYAYILDAKMCSNTVYVVGDEYMVAGRLSYHDAMMIAHAPTDIRDLLALVDQQRGELDRLTSQARKRDDMAKARVVQFQQSRDNEQMLAEALMRVAPDVLKALPLHQSVNELDKVMIEFGNEQRAKDEQLDTARRQRETMQTTITQQGDEIAKLARLATFAAQAVLAIYADPEHRLTLDAIHYLQLLEGALSRAGLLDLKALDQTGYLHMHEGRAVDINPAAGEGE